jgi:hypothetical protein
VFGAYGALTPEKRLPQILDAFAALPYCAVARLLLAGGAGRALRRRRRRRAPGSAARHPHRVHRDDDELTDCIAASGRRAEPALADRARGVGALASALAAGVPTVTIDLAHTWHVPALDPRTWQCRLPGGRAAPVTVAIDILDEDHSLRLAMRRLARRRSCGPRSPRPGASGGSASTVGADGGGLRAAAIRSSSPAARFARA